MRNSASAFVAILTICGLNSSLAQAQTQNAIFTDVSYPKFNNNNGVKEIQGRGVYDVNTSGGYTFVSIVLKAKDSNGNILTNSAGAILGGNRNRPPQKTWAATVSPVPSGSDTVWAELTVADANSQQSTVKTTDVIVLVP